MATTPQRQKRFVSFRQNRAPWGNRMKRAMRSESWVYITASARRNVPATRNILKRSPIWISVMRKTTSTHIAHGLNPSKSPKMPKVLWVTIHSKQSVPRKGYSHRQVDRWVLGLHKHFHLHNFRFHLLSLQAPWVVQYRLPDLLVLIDQRPEHTDHSSLLLGEIGIRNVKRCSEPISVPKSVNDHLPNERRGLIYWVRNVQQRH